MFSSSTVHHLLVQQWGRALLAPQCLGVWVSGGPRGVVVAGLWLYVFRAAPLPMHTSAPAHPPTTTNPRPTPPTAAPPPPLLLQSLLHSLILHHKPSMYGRLLAHTTLPGESAAASARRWRCVAVSWRRAGRRTLPAERDLPTLPMQEVGGGAELAAPAVHPKAAGGTVAAAGSCVWRSGEPPRPQCGLPPRSTHPCPCSAHEALLGLPRRPPSTCRLP
jgi:hypothetical protein